MKFFVFLIILIIVSSCASTKNKHSELDSLFVGSWLHCGTAEYNGKVTGSGSTTTFNADNTYKVSVSNVFDDLACSNKVSGVGVLVEGEYTIVGKSSLGENIYDINLTNWGNSGWPCFTIARINDDGVLYGKSSWSPKMDCKTPSRRHVELQDEKFIKKKI